MYVCICNAIRESDLRDTAAVTNGCAITTYEKMGKTPNCGQCLQNAEKILDEVRGLATCEQVAV